MSKEPVSLSKAQTIMILGAIWLVSNFCDRLWLALDNFPPGWDQSNHLNNALKYLSALQTPQIFAGEWWHSFWQISTKYPPFTYIVTATFQQVFGTGNDQALLVNLFYSAILITSVYLLGKTLFSPQVGLWAAGLTMLFPRLYQTRLQYLIDTPLLSLTVACFCCLTLWRSQKTRRGEWFWTVVFGVFWGLALLTKQSVMFFLIAPLIYLVLGHLWQRNWRRIAQLIVSFIISVFIWFPWYRSNWIYLFSTAQNSNVIPATYEGDPALNTLAAWTYYWQDLPSAISWILLIVPVVGLLLHLLVKFPNKYQEVESKKAIQGIAWLSLYFLSSYLICSAILNKDTRYIMPYLPILAVFLAYCLTLWRGRWKYVRWGTVIVAFLVMLFKLFPTPGMGDMALTLSPGVLSHPYTGKGFPNTQLIETVIQEAPYQRSTLGVITNTEAINHNTLNYYGSLENFQVYGRELGSTPEEVAQDKRSLNWLITKTGDNGFAKEAQLALAKQIETDPNFQLSKTWQLPDNDTLKLYHRQTPPVIVKALSETRDKVQLDQVIVPTRVPPGIPVPITYEWSGSWQQLASGLLLLTWHPIKQQEINKQNSWIHDRAIGMGMLYSGNPDSPQPQDGFSVSENTAMLPEKNLPPGDYTLSATYLNRKTGETYPIVVPPVTLTIDANASPLAAPELDLVTQLRQLALNLPKGTKGLDPIFKQVDRINQYDPTQDYLLQAEKTLAYRLAYEPGKHQLDWSYGLVLSQVLQENAKNAIATLQQLIKLDPQNPYAHAYLAFVYLYDWQPKAAQQALEPALAINPNNSNIQVLNGISALMQGNLIQAWKILSPLLN